jgi:lactoylglutathione lyase
MRIEHVAIWCSDLEALRAFYVEYFDARSSKKYTNEKKGFESYFLSFGSGARLELMRSLSISRSTDDPYQQVTGLAHFAISVGSKDRVDELTHQLQSAGIKVIDGPRRTGDGYYESVILDLEQNRIEITV